MKNNCEKGKLYSTWKSKVYENWNRVKVINIEEEDKNGDLKVGNMYPVLAEIELGDLTPDDVDVQIYFGGVDNGSTEYRDKVNMTYMLKKSKSGKYTYRGEIDCKDTGQFGFTLRILPKHELLINQFELGLIRWA